MSYLSREISDAPVGLLIMSFALAARTSGGNAARSACGKQDDIQHA
jgi:hypothetical protein